MNWILYRLRRTFLLRARRSRDVAYELYQAYPFGSFGWAKADLLWECGNLWRELARAIRGKR